MNNGKQMVSWAKGANIYEVNIRQYTAEGTFNAFAQHLPRLKDMGVEIFWLMPVTPISKLKRLGTLGSYYACSSYTAINPEFGTMDDFLSLVQTVHSLDMKIIIDWVANHTGADHHWSIEHPDWYKKDSVGNFAELNGWADVIHLDYSKTDMRAEMVKSMQFWIEEGGIDGFRCDMAHLVPLDFWIEAREQCDAIRPLFWLAECDEMAYHAAFDVSYAWEWMHASENLAKGASSLGEMKNVLFKYAKYPQGALKLYFTSNHDENTWNGTEYEKYHGAARAFAVFTCTWPGMPMVYSGQELPNVKRLKFFDKDQIDWKPDIVLHNFYKALLNLRKTHTCLQGGVNAFAYILPTQQDDKILTYLLTDGSNKVIVMLNFSQSDKLTVNVRHAELAGKYENIISGLQYDFKQQESFELQAWEFMVYAGV